MEPQIAEIEPISVRGSEPAPLFAGSFFTLPRFAVMLGLLLLAAFPDVLLGAKSFFFRDYTLFGYPLAHYHREAFWRGEIPLWNPLNNCGIPYAAQWNTMVFYPFSLIYLLLPLPWSLGWFCLFHLFLGGLGMYRLAFRWTDNSLAAAIAGVSFSFSGVALSFLIWPNNASAFGWLPWVLWMAQKGWSGPRSDLLKAVCVGSIQMLSGAPEIIFFTWLLVGGLWCCDLPHQPNWRRSLMRVIGLVLLIAGICAIQLLPFLDLLHQSHRKGDIGSASWSMPAYGWANFLVPLFHTVPTATGVHMQPGQGWVSSYYLGVVPLFLGLFAVITVRSRIALVLGTALLASVVLALGEHTYVYQWLRVLLPGLGLMRFPVKFVVVAAAAVPLLAAFAAARVTELSRPPLTRRGLALGIGLIVLTIGLACYAWRFPAAGEAPQATLLSGFGRAAFLAAILVLLLLRHRFVRARLSSFWQIILVTLLWGDLVSHAPRQNPTVAARSFRYSTWDARQENQPGWDRSARAALTLDALEKFHSTFVTDFSLAVLGERGGLYKNCNLLENVAKVDGFYSLYIPEEQQIEFNLYRTETDLRKGLADFLGVARVTSDQSIVEWRRRDTHLPLVTAGQQPVFAAPDETLSLLRANFSPRDTVYIEPNAKEFVHASTNVAVALDFARISADRIRITASSADPAMVVVAETWFHWWKATVDGKPARLWRANYAFQALEMPPGKHQLELVYSDRSFVLGALISGATLVLCLVGALTMRHSSGKLGT